MIPAIPKSYRHRQSGVAAVEFSLIAAVLFTLLFSIMEMGRVLFYWNTATEATRLGARIAAVCNLDDAAIKSQMTSLFPVIASGDIQIDYSPSGCSTGTCAQVTVQIQSSTPIQTTIPFLPLSVTLPPFLTTLPRESMSSSVGGVTNPICQS